MRYVVVKRTEFGLRYLRDVFFKGGRLYHEWTHENKKAREFYTNEYASHVAKYIPREATCEAATVQQRG